MTWKLKLVKVAYFLLSPASVFTTLFVVLLITLYATRCRWLMVPTLLTAMLAELGIAIRIMERRAK
jgi:hypothetical protein